MWERGGGGGREREGEGEKVEVEQLESHVPGRDDRQPYVCTQLSTIFYIMPTN